MSGSAVPDINRLYDCAQTLSSLKPDKITEHTSEYETILKGVRGDTQTKKLASQFIARFSSQFPNLGDASLDAILDLCEDDDVNIRKQAIKDLPMMCRDRKDYLPKIVDVLTQLLQTDEETEVTIIQSAIMSLLRKNCKGTLIGLFCQVKTGGDLVRERALKFLHMKLKTESKELLNKEGEIHLFEEIKACTFEGCTAEEFQMFMTMLSLTSIPKSSTGKSMIVEMIGKMIDFEKPFSADDEESIDRIIQCYHAATDYISDQVKSTKFCEYLCLKVLPEWESILSTDQAKLMRILAELCAFTGKIQQPNEAVSNIHTVLMEYLPESAPADQPAESDSEVEFTKVESLLFAFHTVAQMSTFLTDNPELFKQFKARLQSFALGIQGYMRELRSRLTGLKGAQLTTGENKKKAVALKSATNINSLIKDLLHPTPTFKTKIGLSWKPIQDLKAPKRKSISFDQPLTPRSASDNGPPKKKFAKTPMRGRGSRGGGTAGVYAPPTGKYSSGINTSFDGGRGGRRGRGRFRGGRN